MNFFHKALTERIDTIDNGEEKRALLPLRRSLPAMNPKVFLYLLAKISDRPGSRDRGLALPFALVIGLVLLVVGATMIITAQNSQQKSAAQQVTAKALSMAETGVTRIQDLINQNRYISLFPDCLTRNSSGQCNDPSASPKPQSWATITSVPGMTVCGTTGNATAVAAVASSQNWIAINSSNADQGEYRLLSYQYTPTVGQAPGVGLLTVEGRVNNSKQLSNAAARLQVSIPVEPGPIATDAVPGVWLVKGDTGNNNKIQGDVLLNDCSVPQSSLDAMNNDSTGTIVGTDPVTGQPYEAKYTSMVFPDLPSKPSPFLNTLNLPNGTSGVITLPCKTAPCSYSTTPTVADQPNSQGKYEYSANNIKLQTGSSKLIITPGEKVTIYLDGEIDGNTEIVHNCAGVTGCKPTDFQIYGYAKKTTSPAFTPEICLIGNNQLEAFIYAKEYRVGVGGTGVFRGTIWAGEWSTSGGCGSNTSNIVVEQTARWSDLGLQPKNTPPILKNISSWQHQQR